MTIPTDVTVTGVSGVSLEGTRSRLIGRNARLPVHGKDVSEPVVRLFTDAGVSGWGWSPATREDAQRLVGQRLHEVFSPDTGTQDDLLMFDFPLWDVAGQLLDRPVHAMLGDSGSSPVPVYDGGIYIDELDPDTGRDDGIEPMLYAVNVGSSPTTLMPSTKLRMRALRSGKVPSFRKRIRYTCVPDTTSFAKVGPAWAFPPTIIGTQSQDAIRNVKQDSLNSIPRLECWSQCGP